LFTALGDERGDGSWVVRIHYKPFVLWIWLGAIFMAFGGVLAITDKRYRSKKTVKQSQNESVTSGSSSSKPTMAAES
jgi:cytochrome c-type biogenesis protein CcmF